MLKQKSLGASIMVSNFIDEVGGFVCDGAESACMSLETSKEGYFTNDHLLKRVEKQSTYLRKSILKHKGYFYLIMPLLIVKWLMMH